MDEFERRTSSFAHMYILVEVVPVGFEAIKIFSPSMTVDANSGKMPTFGLPSRLETLAEDVARRRNSSRKSVSPATSLDLAPAWPGSLRSFLHCSKQDATHASTDGTGHNQTLQGLAKIRRKVDMNREEPIWDTFRHT
jgi:hypothetical protein